MNMPYDDNILLSLTNMKLFTGIHASCGDDLAEQGAEVAEAVYHIHFFGLRAQNRPFFHIILRKKY